MERKHEGGGVWEAGKTIRGDCISQIHGIAALACQPTKRPKHYTTVN